MIALLNESNQETKLKILVFFKTQSPSPVLVYRKEINVFIVLRGKVKYHVRGPRPFPAIAVLFFPAKFPSRSRTGTMELDRRRTDTLTSPLASSNVAHAVNNSGSGSIRLTGMEQEDILYPLVWNTNTDTKYKQKENKSDKKRPTRLRWFYR